MKLLTVAAELEKEFKRLINQYEKFYWATAWASAGSPPFSALQNNREKIGKIVVGIHFYQTHPDFIEYFLNDRKVHFIQQPDGTFHPKIYLFANNTKEWELIVGSANFTSAAFSGNTEASILMSQTDSDSNATYNEALSLVERTFSLGQGFNEMDLAKYRLVWKNQQEKIKSLSGQYASKGKNPRPIYEVPATNMSWEEFMGEIKKEKTHELKKRLRVIEVSKDLFLKANRFENLTSEERKFIAGIPNKLEVEGSEDWGYFGSMQGRGDFKKNIILNDPNISKALDQIPLFGEITKQQYDNYIEYFSKAFPGNYIATATRLLCMKRPDTFICFDSKNRSNLCKAFRIVQSNMDYNRYWDDIIERICDSEWWLNPKPKNEQERKVSEARAAFLDSLYYQE